MTDANVINFASVATQHALLWQLKHLLNDSYNTTEQAALQFIQDIEDLYQQGQLSLNEFSMLSGKAADVLCFFRFDDVATLARASRVVREGIVLQLCIAMLQALRLMRPDLSENNALAETAYALYRYQWPCESSPATHAHRPLTCKNWMQITH